MSNHRIFSLLPALGLIAYFCSISFAQTGPPNQPDPLGQSVALDVKNDLNLNRVDNQAPVSSSVPSPIWPHPPQGIDFRHQVAPPYSNYVPAYEPMRIEAARRTANQFRSQASASSPLLSEIAKTNANLVDQWAELADKINIVMMRVIDSNNKFDFAARDYNDVGSNLHQHGLTPTMGLLLSHKRTQLDEWQVSGSAGHFVNDELQSSRKKQLENGLFSANGDVSRQTSELLASAGYDKTHIDYAQLTSHVQSLLRERNEWLKYLTQGYNDYRQRLGELNTVSTALDQLIVDYRKLINRHVTWVKSNDPLAFSDFQRFRAGLDSLFDSRRSSDFASSLKQKWNSNPVSGLMLLGSILMLVLLRILAMFWLTGIGRKKRMQEATSNARKCVASLLTPLVAVAIPGILYVIARWLGTGYVTESLLHSSSGLYAASFVALLIEVPRNLLRTNGFVEKHLKIDLPRRQRASGYLRLIGVGLVLFAYIATLAGRIDHGTWNGSVARLVFIASLLIVAWTAHLALKPMGGFLEPLVEKLGGTVLYRVRLLFYFASVGFPLAMILISSFGYDFTAIEVIKRAGFMFVAILVGATLWSAVKILTSAAWHLLTGTKDERLFFEQGESQVARVSGVLAERSLELKHQMAFLGQCGLALAAILSLGWMWIDILPSAQLGNPVVWTVQETVTQSFVDANGQKVSRSDVASNPVTLLHLIFAGATLFVAFQLAKLLPAIFDVLVLQRVNFDEAMEHLSLVVGRFLLFGAGCFIACRFVGLRWETIQWLAIGLAIGVGFALQDIIRNLFGGLVVLFEKPARLGDLITVGNVTGRVSEQKLRTTVLSDENGREVIVPNKNFVSEDVVNWMGAGRLKAIPIEVAVTRDERPADVCRMLQQLLLEQPDLMLSPAPHATLVCVSQHWQRIELRAWVDGDKDVSRLRDSLTRTVLSFLEEKNLLAPNQPRQPSVSDSFETEPLRGISPRKKRPA